MEIFRLELRKTYIQGNESLAINLVYIINDIGLILRSGKSFTLVDLNTHRWQDIWTAGTVTILEEGNKEIDNVGLYDKNWRYNLE